MSKPALRIPINATDYSQTMNFLFKREDNSVHAMCTPACTIFLVYFRTSELICRKTLFFRKGGC